MEFKDSNIPEYFQQIRKNLNNDEQYYLFLSMVANILGPIFEEQKTFTEVKGLLSYIDLCSEFVGGEIVKTNLNLSNINDKHNMVNKTKLTDEVPKNNIVNNILTKINSKKTKGKK